MNTIGARKYWLSFSGILVLLSVGVLVTNQATRGSVLNFGVDFTGGSLLTYRLHDDVDVAKVRTAVSPLGLAESTIQKSGDQDVTIRTQPLDDGTRLKVTAAVTQAYPKAEALSVDTIGPVVGKELRVQALWALLVASLLITVYVTYRFEWRYAIAALLALYHDAIITTGVMAMLWANVETPFIAAILTIMGYSIMDTIVIFDRIRENLKKDGKIKQPFGELVNDSLLQTMARSINTVLTVLFMNVMLLLFGGAPIREFVLTLLIGFSSGAYSSIFVASPLLVVWQNRTAVRSKK